MVKEVDDPKHLSVFLSRNGTTRKDVTERLRKARKHVNTLHHFWRHTGLPLHWKLRTYNAVFVPMIVYSMESATLTQPDLHRIEAFHSQSLRKMHRVPATILHQSSCTRPTRHFQSTATRAILTATLHTPHPQGTTHVVWSCFESTGKVFGKELLFHKIYSL